MLAGISLWCPALACAALLVNVHPGWSFDPEPDVTPALQGSYLGVGVVEVTAERAKALKLREEEGVEITRVAADSPAMKAGLQTGDILLGYNDQRLEGVEQFVRMVQETPPGRTVHLACYRNGHTVKVAVRTGARKGWMASGPSPGLPELPENPGVALPLSFGTLVSDIPRPLMTWRNAILGFEGESLDAQLAEFFGVKSGVLVRSVVRGSTAETIGLHAGDVIVRVNNTLVTTPREITAALQPQASKGTTLAIVRDRSGLRLHIRPDNLPDTPTSKTHNPQ